MPLGGISTFEYASARDVKKVNIEWVGLRKLNWGFMCSLDASPVRKALPALQKQKTAVRGLLMVSRAAKAGRVGESGRHG